MFQFRLDNDLFSPLLLGRGGRRSGLRLWLLHTPSDLEPAGKSSHVFCDKLERGRLDWGFWRNDGPSLTRSIFRSC